MKSNLLSKELFPEYNIKNLDIKKDKFVIINRILEYGSLQQVKKLFKTYRFSEIRKFVIKHGIKKLSLKSLNFWLCFFNVKNRNKILSAKLKNKLWKF